MLINEEKYDKMCIKQFSKQGWNHKTTAFGEKVSFLLPEKIVSLWEEVSCPLDDICCSYYAHDVFGLSENDPPEKIAEAVCEAMVEELLVLRDKDKIVSEAKKAGIIIGE